jgi:hypothetical protein
MYNFTDLIAKSYLKYVNKGTNEVNIAQVFFQEYYSVRPEAKEKYIFSHKQFYTELINEIDTLTKRAVYNHHLNSLDFEINDAEDFEEFQKKRLLDHQNLIDDAGVTYVVKRVDYEECTNAKQLTEALKYGLNLIDPVKIITPSKTIQADDLVLRKSKLEYLKAEAIRARDTNSIDGLSEVRELNKNISGKPVDLSVYNLDYIEDIVKDRFKFTLEVQPRKKVPMLSNDEYLQLVRWVTYFFINNYELPNNITPILGNKIGKTRIRTAFKNLFHFCHPRQPLPKSFYGLVPFCFHALKDDNEETMQKTSDPDKDL